MLSAVELNFSTTSGASLPAWISNRGRVSLRLWPESAAKTVTLRLGTESVIVRVREQSSVFVGEILRFEPSHSETVQGARVGEPIVFKQEHIFAACD